MPKFMTGYRPDPPDVVARRPGFHLLRAHRLLVQSKTLPLFTNNKQYLLAAKGGPGILQQLQTGSCTGHSTAGAITSRFAIMGTPIKLVSPIGLYAVGRAMARRPNVDGNLLPLTDDGTEPSLVVAGINEWGVCSADTWGNYPADPLTINNEPTLEQLEADAEFELNGAYFLQSQGTALYNDIMTALAAGYPVTNAIPASGDSFQNYTGGVLGAQSGPNDHYTYIIDYSWDGENYDSLILYCVNSWGTQDGWGDGTGMYQANTQFIDQMQDMAIFDVSSVAGANEQ